VTWDDTNASDHIVAIREKMAESANGGAQKKQKTAAVPAAKAAAKAKDASTGKCVSYSHSCALCGLVCGDDCVGVSEPQAPEVGSVVFRKACREKLFASKWWASTRSICKEKCINKK
jgi:hypothetical protein